MTFILSILTSSSLLSYSYFRQVNTDDIRTDCKIIGRYISDEEKKDTQFMLIVETPTKRTLELEVSSVTYFKTTNKTHQTFMLSPRQLNTMTDYDKNLEVWFVISLIIWVAWFGICFVYVISESI
jgi:hypothetical protein